MSIFDKIHKKIKSILVAKYKIAKVYSFSEYSKLYPCEYKTIFPARETIVYPIRFYKEPVKEPVVCSLPETYYARIQDCFIIGQSNIVLTKQNYLLHDYLSDSTLTNINVTDKGLFLILNRAIHLGKYYIINYMGIYDDKIENGIMMSGNFSKNYYHFMLEFLVKFDYISKMSLDKDIPIILDRNVKQIKQFEELLSIFNKEKRPIIYIDNQKLYHIRNLHYISFVNKIPANFKGKASTISSSDFAFDFNSINFLRKVMYEFFEMQTLDTPRKIFISRKNFNIRKSDESELYPLLEKNNFSIIFPEKFNIKEQFFHFANAEHIIASSGAALTNIVFCKPGCKILVFQPTKADITVFSSIAAFCKTNMIYLSSKHSVTNLHDDFKIPKELVEEYLCEFDNPSEDKCN